MDSVWQSRIKRYAKFSMSDWVNLGDLLRFTENIGVSQRTTPNGGGAELKMYSVCRKEPHADPETRAIGWSPESAEMT